MPKITYLDYNATTPVRPEVVAHMSELLAHPHNPSSVHFYGREGKKYLENARSSIARALNCWANEIIFTASGTEANNMVCRAYPDRRLLLSAVEHSSIIKTVPDALRIPVNRNGVIDVASLKALLEQDKKPALLLVMLANNETGVIQPIAEIAKLAKEYGALIHTDAAQALGKIPVDFSMLGVDMMTVSAHKMGGAPGAAALILRNDLPIKPLLSGGGQELGRRAGTENVAAISGFALAVDMALAQMPQMQALRDYLTETEENLLEFAPETIVFGRKVDRLPNTSCITMHGVNSETQLMAFDLVGIAVSAGSACSSGRIESSHVIRAMGFPDEIASTAIRISAGWNTQPEAFVQMEQEWKKLHNRVTQQPKRAIT